VASKRRLRRRSCESKVPHPTETAAAAHARSIGSGWYPCGNHWHVGRPSKRQRQSYAAKAANRRVER
jgi:hypothetical protein